MLCPLFDEQLSLWSVVCKSSGKNCAAENPEHPFTGIFPQFRGQQFWLGEILEYVCEATF